MATTPQTNTTFDGIADLLRSQDDFVICGHVGPDGDCLSSQLALWHALRALGKNATCILVKDDPIPFDLAFMPGTEEMVPACAFEGAARVFVGVDVPSRERIGIDACAILDACETSITIDHHAADVPMCEHVYVDPDSASASLLVWEVVKRLVEDVPFECALCAYTGLVTDTGGFRYQNADSRAFACASELIELGVDPSYVATQVYQNRTLASVKLESIMASRIVFVHGADVAISWVTADEMASVGAVKADTEPLINTLRSIRGVRIACILREQDGVIRGSLRAKDDTDVASLAKKLGGGGHRAAAGLTLAMTLDEALALMRDELDVLARNGEVA